MTESETMERALARLVELGVSAAGAQQLLAGETVASADDRTLIAGVAAQLLGNVGVGGPMAADLGDVAALETDPGTSKVKTRILGTNFDG